MPASFEAPPKRESFADLDVWCWSYETKSKNWRGVHLAATPTACAALQRCIAAVRDGEADRRSCSIPLRPFRTDPWRWNGSTPIPLLSLVISLCEPSPELGQCCIGHDGETARIDIVGEFAGELVRAFEWLQDGVEDWTFGPRKKDRSKRALPFGERDRASLPLWMWRPHSLALPPGHRWRTPEPGSHP